MANVNSVQHAAGVEQKGPFAWATYEIASGLTSGDTITFFELPAGTTVFGGWLVGDDLDTGIETIDIDVGDADDADRFGNFGVITGDAVTGTKPEVGILQQLFGTLKDGPHTYTTATNVIATVNAPAATGGTGTINLILMVQMDDARVSPPDAPI